MGLTLASNAALDAEVDKLIVGTPAFVQQRWTGPTISGANKYLLQIGACVVYSEIGESECELARLIRGIERGAGGSGANRDDGGCQFRPLREGDRDSVV